MGEEALPGDPRPRRGCRPPGPAPRAPLCPRGAAPPPRRGSSARELAEGLVPFFQNMVCVCILFFNFFFFYEGRERISATRTQILALSPEGRSGAGGQVDARARPGGGMSRCPARAGTSPGQAGGEGCPPPPAPANASLPGSRPGPTGPRGKPRPEDEGFGSAARSPWGG